LRLLDEPGGAFQLADATEQVLQQILGLRQQRRLAVLSLPNLLLTVPQSGQIAIQQPANIS
jgi:hypothetical protein